MPGVDALGLAAVFAAGLYLLALGTASLVVPARATRFLLGFARSRRAHIAELALRLVAGAAFVVQAPHMVLPGAFRLFGGVLVATTAILVVLPWRWHQRFATHAVPRATRHMVPIGLVSVALGGLIVAAVVGGRTA